VGGKPHPGGGNAANRRQSGVREGVSSGEVGPWVKGGGEDKAQPFQAGLWVEELILKLHREGARRLIAPAGPPVDQLGFRNREGDVDWGGLSLERQEGLVRQENEPSLIYIILSPYRHLDRPSVFSKIYKKLEHC